MFLKTNGLSICQFEKLFLPVDRHTNVCQFQDGKLNLKKDRVRLGVPNVLGKVFCNFFYSDVTFNGNGDIVHLHTASFESVKNLFPIKLNNNNNNKSFSEKKC